MSTEIGSVRTDLDAEKNARIEADTALSTKIEVASSINRYEIENLKAKAEGKLYRTETVEAEAYTVGMAPQRTVRSERFRVPLTAMALIRRCRGRSTSSCVQGPRPHSL